MSNPSPVTPNSAHLVRGIFAVSGCGQQAADFSQPLRWACNRGSKARVSECPKRHSATARSRVGETVQHSAGQVRQRQPGANPAQAASCTRPAAGSPSSVPKQQGSWGRRPGTRMRWGRSGCRRHCCHSSPELDGNEWRPGCHTSSSAAASRMSMSMLLKTAAHCKRCLSMPHSSTELLQS